MSTYSPRATFASGNTISAVGNYRIVSFVEPFVEVTGVTGFSDSVTGEEGSSVYAQRDFRWSRDGDNWSLWTALDAASPGAITALSLDPDEPLYLEFRYTAMSDPTASPSYAQGTPFSPDLLVEWVALELSIREVSSLPEDSAVHSLCSDEFCALPVLLQDTFTFDPYAINRAVCLFKDLSRMVNNMFGHEVGYYRVTPQQRSADVVLGEWTIFGVSQERCVKVMVPNNQFPDNRPILNEFGLDFEQPFEVHIDKAYFESFFGKGAMPQKRDVIYFPLLNRVYEVGSAYLFRDFMQQGIYHKVLLVKYQPRADTVAPGDVAQRLDDLTVTTKELFGEAASLDTERVVHSQQFVTITHDSDPTRALVNRKLPIAHLDLYNNWTLIAEHFYDLATLWTAVGKTPDVALSYRATASLPDRSNRAFTCWFRPAAGGADKTRNLLNGMTAGSGVRIDLVYDPAAVHQVRLTLNSDVHDFDLTGISLSEDRWYALVVNYSSEFDQAGVYLWSQQAGSSELLLSFHEVRPVPRQTFDTGRGYEVLASPLSLTAIRLFSAMVEEEHMPVVLCQMVVKDSHRAIVIDNARPLLRLPKISNPK